MGYTTQFEGQFNLSKPLTDDQSNYLHTFSGTRRMKRNSEMLMNQYNGQHGLNGNYGIDGEFFCFDDGDSGQTQTPDIVEYNDHPTILMVSMDTNRR